MENALPEQSQWENDIYQIEVSVPVMDGEGGIANLQATQLGNRTRFLKDQLDALELRITTLENT